MKDNEESLSWVRAREQLKQSIAAMTCLEISAFLDGNWENTPVSTLYLYVSELANKHCERAQAMPYLLKMLQVPDSFYRHVALHFIKDLGGREYKQTFLNVARNDDAEDVVQTALMNVTDLFRDEKDTEVLSLAYSIYENPNSSTQLKLAAAAAMMYQLGIPHDAQGRPAWWDEDEETIDHPALQRAIAQTKHLLSSAGSKE